MGIGLGGYHLGIKALTQQLATKKINEEDYATEPINVERRQLVKALSIL